MRKLLSTMLALAAGVAIPGVAVCQDAQGGAIAESLFREGQELMKAKKVHKACEKFAASYRLDPALGTLLNLAVCHEKDGLTASAWTEFSEVAAKTSRAGQKDREAFSRARLKALEPKLARATLAVARPTEGMKIALDGRELSSAAWDSALPVDPGEHKLEADAPGKKQWSKTFVVTAAQLRYRVEVPALENMEVVAPPTPAAAERPLQAGAEEQPAMQVQTTPDVTASPKRSTRRIVGYSLIGGGAGLIAVGGICMGLAASSAKDARNAKTTAEWNSAKSSGRTKAVVGDVLAGTGLVAAGFGLYYVLSHPHSSAPTAVTVAPLQGGGAVMVSGGF